MRLRFRGNRVGDEFVKESKQEAELEKLQRNIESAAKEKQSQPPNGG